ncbi:CocE/NonD family hydrolase [Devosia nitrariae]|uniref:Esterase n=1 Tax=Devosia nitrariae TaxID=2071872 RepID=A0ABQ5W9J0_9HYPH|nr:CocE/NonD family hydrolase [Devosia nitrariae]GLQ56215.1 esterase [Devosia nitrariae]
MKQAFGLLDSVEIPMRDGTILRADIWLPGEGSWPVILQRTPYRKEDAFGTQYISALEFKAALRRGYAIVVQDTRGRYGSDGEFVPFSRETEDGADTIAWLREQDFCNGQVVMFGASYVGATQVLAASGNPKGLVAVSPHLTTARHGETWTYRSGASELAFLLLWIIESLAPEDLQRRLDTMPAEDASRATRLLAELRQDPLAAFSRLPILDEDLVALAPYAADWFDNHRAISTPADREHLDALAQTRLPFLVSCGWNDLFVEGAIELFETARRCWGRAEDVPDRLIIGPWSHGNPTDWQGDFWLGYAASTAQLSDEQLAFFDAATAGELPATPMVRYFRSGSNSWHAAPDWPLPGTTGRELFLAGTELREAACETDWSRSYLSDALNPVPTVGGANFLPGLVLGKNSGPKDQAQIERREDVLVFTSEPMAEDLEVTGLVEAVLWVSSSGASADWVARLCEVDSSGRSIGLVDGIYRQQVSSEGPTEVTVRLGHISHLFRRGNRFRLQIASSNFPRFDRNPQSGALSVWATKEDFVTATHAVHGGPALPSRLILPVISLPFPEQSGLASPG